MSNKWAVVEFGFGGISGRGEYRALSSIISNYGLDVDNIEDSEEIEDALNDKINYKDFVIVPITGDDE